MKKSFVVLTLIVLMLACKDEEKISRLQLLTNGSTKSWNVTAESPESSEISCRPDTDFASDNSWAFSSDGTFKYDHGTLTEGEVCSDMRNLTGNWKFTESESNLLITLLYETGNPSYTFDGDTLFLTSIETLTTSTLTLKQDGQSLTFSPK